jgi:UDP-N-acetylmuramoyl-tripeptide--D-alanyl-D-alanine ligase
MEDYKLQRMLNVLDIDTGSFDASLLERDIAGISTDSRSIRKGEVLFAIRGDNYDGFDYVDDAHGAGALFSIVNEDSAKGKRLTSPHGTVRDTVKALGDTAADYRSMFGGTVIAVTGTNGKTTVKEMLLNILGARFSAHGTKGNFNNHIGLPLSVFGLEPKHDCAVFELGMNAPGEIAYLGEIAKPDIGVILNAGQGHIGFFQNVDEIADAKMELLGSIRDGGVAVVNGDDELLIQRTERAHTNVVTFGIHGDHDYKAENIVLREDGCARFTVNGNSVDLMIQGIHNVYNALAAYAVGGILNMDGVSVAQQFKRVKAPKMRMERFMKNGIHFVNDTYNANPVSMKVAAEIIRFMHNERKIAVLGDMLELGNEAVELHEEIGELYGELGLEWLCLIGEYADVYKEAAVRGGMSSGKIKIFSDNDSVTEFLNGVKQTGDVIFAKGSRALKLEQIIDAVSGGN